MKTKEKIRIVVDTNIWISTFLSESFRVKCRILFHPNIQRLFSEKLFREIDNTIRKPKFHNRIDLVGYDNYSMYLKETSELVEVHSVVELCRDPKDNFLLALAKDGNADYLITGDDDLLTLKNFGKTKIVKITEFEQTV